MSMIEFNLMHDQLIFFPKGLWIISYRVLKHFFCLSKNIQLWEKYWITLVMKWARQVNKSLLNSFQSSTTKILNEGQQFSLAIQKTQINFFIAFFSQGDPFLTWRAAIKRLHNRIVIVHITLRKEKKREHFAKNKRISSLAYFEYLLVNSWVNVLKHV